MANLDLVYSGFSPSAVTETAAAKQRVVDGESFILDWIRPEHQDARESFRALSEGLSRLFGPAFHQQRHFHTTIISKRLDPIDRMPNTPVPEWADAGLEKSRAAILRFLDAACLEVRLCVLSQEGTCQLVFRDEGALPLLRRQLLDLGAEAKPGTLDGDRINTCTMVLGHLGGLPDAVPSPLHVEHLLQEWCAQHGLINVNALSSSLVRYRDTSLAEYSTVRVFP